MSESPALPLLFLLTVSCAVPAAPPHSRGAVVARLDARADDVAGAFERAGIATTVMPPLDPAAVADPARFDHWCAAALLYNPVVRRARREVDAAASDARAAGRLEDVGAGVIVHDFAREDRLVEGMVAFDPLAVFGLGAARAERRMAGAAEALAIARLDAAMWDAMMEVEMARLSFAAARARLQAIEGVSHDVERGITRTEILFESGRAGATEREMALLARAMVARGLAEARADEARARERLALASGLPSAAPAFDAVGEDAFADLPGWSVDDPEEVSPLHPRLRVARFELELAEAEARAIAAEAWPRIEIGPQLSIEGGTRVGGLVDLRLPWPPTLEKRIRAAAARRDAAVYAYEDALHREREALVRARASVSAARERASQAGAVEHAERRSFEAANARFFVGGAEIGAWAQALGSALDAAALSARSRAEIAFAELDLLDARGVIDRMGRANGEMSAMRTEPRR